MRGNYGHSVFVRCEVALKRATYHIVLSDAANYPSPFRLENLSQISVSYCQSGAGRANVVSQLNPGQSIPYAWDEQTLPKKLCVHVKGSRESQELDFETFGSRGKLYYESYFYITAADTFPPKDERFGWGSPPVQNYIVCKFDSYLSPALVPTTVQLCLLPPLSLT